MLTNPRILLIEIDRDLSQMLKTALEQAQYVVECVPSADMAVHALRRANYAAVIRVEANNTAVLETLALAAARAQGWSIDRLEREYIKQVVATVQGHRGRAAEALGIDRRTLYRKLKEYATTET